MQATWSSFKSRFLVIMGILFLLLLGIAIYTSSTVSTNSKKRQNFIEKYKSIEKFIHHSRDSLRYLQTSLYSYSLLLESKYHKDARTQLERLTTVLGTLSQHEFVRDQSSVQKSYINFRQACNQLIPAIRTLMAYQAKAEKRYPGMKIMLTELQPTNLVFVGALSIAIEDTDETLKDFKSLTKTNRKIQRLFLDLRHTWTQQVSTIRVFIANRSGTFGSPKASMRANIKNQKIYAQQIELTLNLLKKYDIKNQLGIEQSEALRTMLTVNTKYQSIFSRAKQIFISSQWRTDIYLISSNIQQNFSKTLISLKGLDRAIHNYRETGTDSLQKSTSAIASYVWWYFILAVGVMTLAYFLFEYTIRRPLSNISAALDAESKGKHYRIPSLPFQSIEIAILETSFRRMRDNVLSRQERLEAILMQAGEGIIILDQNGLVETFNNAAEQDFLYKSQDIIGQHVSVLMDEQLFNSKLEAFSVWIAKGNDLQENREVLLKKKSGDIFTASINVNTLKINGEWLYVSVIADMSEHKKLMHELQTMADHDDLTNLNNRRYFSNNLKVTLTKNEACILFYIDLDNFKFINDTLGHVAGDKTLRDIACILQKCVRRNDLLARIGGDEFAVVLYAITIDKAQNIAETIRDEISKYNLLYKGKSVDIACSIGIASNERGIQSVDDLMSNADIACNLAKKDGRNRVHIFQNEDKQNKDEIYRNKGWARQIQRAIDESSFVIALQPVVRTSDREIIFNEVLVRMMDQNNNLIMPNGFITAAERFGLIAGIDEWVVCNTIKLIFARRSEGTNSRFSVNVSGQSIGNATFLKNITKMVKQAGLKKDELIFEITETVAIEKMSAAIDFIRSVQALGCLTALDDFGAGYSSYAYLKDLPVDIIKIDGCFVNNIDTNKLSYAMVKSMQQIATVMGKTTIAEYVDREQVLNTLQEIGIHYSQGFYLGPPQIIDISPQKASKSA